MAYIVRQSGDLTGYCFLENALEEGIVLNKSNSILVIKMDTNACYARDNTGTPYGSPNSTGCTLILRGTNRREIRTLFNRMYSNAPEPVSILFNPKFDTDTELLTNYALGMVIHGYVVDIMEDYGMEGNEATAQIQLTVKMMVTETTYIGENDQRVHLHISE